MRNVCGDVPWQQLLDAVDGMLGDALEHMAQLGFGIEAVELGGANQRIDRHPCPILRTNNLFDYAKLRIIATMCIG